MPSEERADIITMRVTDSGPVPPAFGESVQMPCDLCGEQCWITETSFPKMVEYPNHRIVCNVCIAPTLIKANLEELQIESSDPRFAKFTEGKTKKDVVEWMIRRSLGGDSLDD